MMLWKLTLSILNLAGKLKFYWKFGDFVIAMKEIMATTGNIISTLTHD